MACVNQPHSVAGDCRIKTFAAFMTSRLQVGATLVERN